MPRNRWFRVGRRASLLTLLAVVAIGATGAVAANVISSGGSAADPALVHAAAVKSVSAGVSSDLAVFRRAAVARDVMPVGLKNAMAQFVPQAGAQPALSRLAGVRHGASIYLVPAQAGVCFVQSDHAALFCAQQATIAQGTAMGLDLCSPMMPSQDIQIAGIIPDGATDARVRLSDGSEQAINASNGVYSTRFQRSGPLPTAVEWTDTDGAHTTPTNMPSDASTLKCAGPNTLPPPSELPTPPNERTAPTVAPAAGP